MQQLLHMAVLLKYYLCDYMWVQLTANLRLGAKQLIVIESCYYLVKSRLRRKWNSSLSEAEHLLDNMGVSGFAEGRDASLHSADRDGNVPGLFNNQNAAPRLLWDSDYKRM